MKCIMDAARIREKNAAGRLAWLLLCLALMMCLLFAMPARADAAAETSRSSVTLMEGVTESTAYVTDSEGVNLRAHILRIQKGADIAFRVTVKDYYSKGSTAESRRKAAESWDKWGFETMKSLVKEYDSAAEKTGEVIAASNGDFYSGAFMPPVGNLVAEGNVLYASSAEPYFAVMEDGSVGIRLPEDPLDGVTEAIGGSVLLVDGRKNCMPKDAEDVRHPRQGIGVCDDGTVVIMNVDGREPASAGAKLYDFAELFSQQGCSRAINFDGGGSATFLTKRPGDSSLVYRNTAGDGFERKLSSSIMVVTEKNDEPVTGEPEMLMHGRDTSLDSIFGMLRCRVNGNRASGFYAINGKSYLFNRWGWGMSKDIEIGDETYTFSKGRLTGCSDKDAGRVIIGYCGGEKDGKNLIYAYHYGNKKLKVGLNPLSDDGSGKMKNWDGSESVLLPWYSMRSEIRNVYIGDGVKTLGKRFLYVSADPVFDGTSTPVGKLRSIRLPASLSRIESQAFFNKPALKDVEIPAKVKKIGKSAFAKSGKGYIQFKGDKPPKFGSDALADTGFTTAYVKKPGTWSGRLKAAGFTKTVAKK